MRFAVCWNLDEVVDAVAALDAPGPLPRRVILVPNSRVAQALRRRTVERGQTPLLAGTTFESVVSICRRTLAMAEHDVRLGEEDLRPMRLRQLFARDLGLQHFDPELFAATRGWDIALAQTMRDLEAAGLAPRHLRLADDARCADVAALWEACDELAGDSCTTPGLVAAAAEELSSAPEWLGDTAFLAIATSKTDVVTARFIRRLPGVTIAYLAARPRRQRHLERVAELFGQEASSSLEQSHPERRFGTDLDIARTFLFERARGPRSVEHRASESPLQSMTLEDHAGIAEELDAAVQWAVDRALDGQPWGELAVLFPHQDPCAHWLYDRLRAVPDLDEPLPIYVAGGIPAKSTTPGTRIRALLDALANHLAAASVTELLPVLQTDGDARRPSKAEAVELAYGLGTVGGSPAHPEGALTWSERIEARIVALQRELAALSESGALEDIDGGLECAAKDRTRRLERLIAVQAAMSALCDVAGQVCSNATLGAIWAKLAEFIDAWLVLPPEPRILPALSAELELAARDHTARELRGQEVLGLIDDTLARLRVPVGRYADGALYLGTVSSAEALPFAAVRIIGLAEGALPPHPAEDAVLPNEVREALAPYVLPITDDRALHQLHAFDAVVRAVTNQLTLSTHRLTLERSYREPSVVFLEAAAALGRSALPVGTKELRRDELQPARKAARARRIGLPVLASSWLALAAEERRLRPSSEPATDLKRVADLAAVTGALDGLLSPRPAMQLPGLHPSRPISASNLRKLLTCPHQFLFESVFHWRAPPEPVPTRELDVLTFGSLLHEVAETFYRQHGSDFSAQRGELSMYLDAAKAIAVEQFDQLLETYPLAGTSAEDHERERLVSQVDDYLYDEWHERPTRRFVATELGFGWDGGLELPTPSGSLWGRGFIDLIEVDRGRTLVRDIKTGKCKPRSGQGAAPQPTVDVQLGFYAAAVQRLADQLGVPSKMGVAYVHTNDREGRERAFVEDYDTLEVAMVGWLDLAYQLLSNYQFPRTPLSDDCTYCAFRPVCGSQAHERAQALLEGYDAGPLHAFAGTKA